MSFGTCVFRFRWVVLPAWLAGAALLLALTPAPDPSANEMEAFLPEDTLHRRATDAIRRSFPNSSGLSEAVIVFERRTGKLNAPDLATVERVARRITAPATNQAGKPDLAGISVRSPGSLPAAKNPLISTHGADGQAALVVVSIPANFITLRCDRIVDHIREILDSEPLPAGLEVAVTGSSGFGHDYADAAEQSHRRTLWVTIIAVVVILLLVYRSPVAALVPLAAISLAAIVALKVLAIGQHYFGLHVGMAERIFVVVLLYGAGTDYSLFFISRFREFINDRLAPHSAVGKALDSTLPAIGASAGTDTAGLLMLCFACYGVFRTTGPAVAIALVVALLAAVTLVPALVAIAGRRMFWPGRIARTDAAAPPTSGERRLWSAVAHTVTARPALVLACVLLVLAVPAWRGTNITWVYDTLADLQPNDGEKVGNARVGLEMAKRHWPVGEISPVTVLVRRAGESSSDNSPADAPSLAEWDAMCGRLTSAVGEIEGVGNVRSLTQPIGKGSSLPSFSLLRAPALLVSAGQYVSPDRHAMRMQVVLDHPAMTLEAMDAVGRIRRGVSAALADDARNVEIHLAGATAETIDLRRITHADFRLIAVLTLGVIFLMVFLLLRDAILSAFMVASTVLSYFATLGVACWVFAGLFGAEGLDWKVEVFLFVVMVAVGVDYNIFLAARIAQEVRGRSLVEATRRAVARTGPVISSCGLIMAATLGSLMAGSIHLLVQLGFALALGMLIDTFIIRPLLLPAFVVLTRRIASPGRLRH